MMDYDRLSPLAVKPAERSRFENGLVQAARIGSPGLLADDARIDLQRTELSRNRAAYYPTVGLRAQFNVADELDDDLGVIAERSDTWSIFGRLNLPLYLGGSRGREHSRLKAQLNEMEFQRDNRSLALMGTIHRQVGELVTRVAAVPRFDRSKALAVKSMSLISWDYDGGKRDISSMLDAYNHARKIELADLDARYGYLLAMAQLVHDAGWSTSLNSRNFYDEFHSRIGELLSR